jgi:poly(A) polymerase
MTKTAYRVIADYLLDPKVKELMAVFRASGNEDAMRFVGGCVRNTLMNIPISDIDIATTLVPEKIKELFEAAGYSVHPTGIEHGTVTVVIKGEPYEITTLRRDVETDGRRAVIEFSTDWADDAERRDFRCNALYMDMDGHIYDYVGGGIEDTKNRQLVFVGSAETRIREDYLRILRMYRFMSALDCTANAMGEIACAELKDGIKTLSGERIEKEMMKLLAGKNALKTLRAMYHAGIYQIVFDREWPEEGFFLERLFRASDDPALRLAGIFNFNTEVAATVLGRWHSATELKNRVMNALEISSFTDDRELAYRKGAPAMHDQVLLSWADGFDERSLDAVKAAIADVVNNLPVLPVRGQDILDLGMKPGKAIGEVLKSVESWWVSNGYPDAEKTKVKLAELVEAAQ